MCVPGRYRLPRSLSTSRAVTACGQRPRDDAFDDLALGIGVVLDVDPMACGKLAFGCLVEAALVVVRPKAVTEGKHAVDLRRTR